MRNREAVEAILTDLHNVAHPLCEHFGIRHTGTLALLHSRVAKN